jgi:SAM-dependent MidA family methyltransferase
MNSPTILLREEIRKSGPISFARFMELALYAPGCGYYERHPIIGRGGDFFTSVSVGMVFGELLAFQFAQWFARMETPPEKFQIVEAGAHDGQLALDILSWWQRQRPQLEIEYCLVEPSPARRAAQEEKLRHKFSNVRWVEGFEQLGGVCGVIFSNELLDAMPVHVLRWGATGRRWLERLVDFQCGEFVWQITEPSPGLVEFLPEVAEEMAAVLPDEFSVEVSPATVRWWTSAAKNLERGKLLALDYGWESSSGLRPERAEGTLRAYERHRVSSDVLSKPGSRDITAHVDFSVVRRAGERRGLKTDFFARQSVFLTEIFRETCVPGSGLEDWSTARVRQFQTLTHPEHLGHRFHALLQSR